MGKGYSDNCPDDDYGNGDEDNCGDNSGSDGGNGDSGGDNGGDGDHDISQLWPEPWRQLPFSHLE